MYMSMATYLSEQELVEIAKAKIGHKTQKDWAKASGISQAYLSDFLLRRRGAGPAILRALGFEPQPYYRKSKDDR